ncbi:MAG: MBL fold metallo-hydrolase [Bifidobacteriaceae bacterium]|jgi:L-ascorbate metabolism protein UlaG (beta-lactamase superfamily)|nr:MBL fold metallo-hydrolase [Bifidobacteriaceae bacterium]
MIIAKHQHACLVLTCKGQNIVVDPGAHTADLPDSLANVTGIVVTHEHPGHFDAAAVERIAAQNPGATVFSLAGVLARLPESIPRQAVVAGDSAKAGGASLEFFGAVHAQVTPGQRAVANLGVMVDGAFAYAGDSFAEPPHPPKAVAVPLAGTWTRLGDAIAYLENIRPGIAIPTHDAALSELGRALYNAALRPAAQEAGVDLRVLAPGQTMDIDI